MAVTIGATMRGPPAVAECAEITGVASRPAASSIRQVDDGQLPVDRLLVGEILGKRCALGDGDIQYISVRVVHNRLGLVGKRLAAKGAPATEALNVVTKGNISRDIRMQIVSADPSFLLPSPPTVAEGGR